MIKRGLSFVFAVIVCVAFSNLAGAFQCGPAAPCGAQPVCDVPIVPLPPCCEASPLFPPAPPLVVPIIVGVPVDQYCAPVMKVQKPIQPQARWNRSTLHRLPQQ